MAVMPLESSFAQSPGTSTVSGVLVNGTQGGETPANATVLLHQFGVDAGSVDTYETTTDALTARSALRMSPPTPANGQRSGRRNLRRHAVQRECISPSDPTESRDAHRVRS